MATLVVMRMLMTMGIIKNHDDPDVRSDGDVRKCQIREEDEYDDDDSDDDKMMIKKKSKSKVFHIKGAPAKAPLSGILPIGCITEVMRRKTSMSFSGP
ncbi:MAG: hypothetical protein J6Y94_03725, partial [Bacteriovoracaceae bacterium]|nr:hypothetical protein [Bacteriovoracaceae bacterium]